MIDANPEPPDGKLVRLQQFIYFSDKKIYLIFYIQMEYNKWLVEFFLN